MKANPSPKSKPQHTGVLLKLTRELIMLNGVLANHARIKINRVFNIQANRHSNQATGRVQLRLKKT